MAQNRGAPEGPTAAPGPWRHALVVGASSGIGEAIVRRLAAGGCRVAALARREDRLRALAAEANGAAGRDLVIPVTHDATRGEEAEALLDRCAEDLGGLDLVVYAAGVLAPVPEDGHDLAGERRMVEVNLLGAVAWLGPAAERFARRGAGTVVGVSSVAGERGRRGNPVYNATKAGLNAYLEGLRNRFAASGVRVVTVKPGYVDTSMIAGREGLFWVISAEEAARRILRAASAGRAEAFVPARWALVAFVLRCLPSFLMRRMRI